MIRHMIQIIIVDNSQSEECQAHCGTDWSSPEAIALASRQIEGRFGNKITLEYLDLVKPTANRRTLELSQQVKKKGLALPLLMINGQPRISGQFDIHLLLEAIDAEMEVKP